MVIHINNGIKDGKGTNPAISKILGMKPEQNLEYDKEYYKFCSRLGITPDNKRHKYWKVVQI